MSLSSVSRKQLSIPADNAPLRVQHRNLGASQSRDADVRSVAPRAEPAASQHNVLGRVRKPAGSETMRVTVRLGLADNSLAFWRRRRYKTAAVFAAALSAATGLHITPAYVRYWETAVGVPPARVVAAVAQLLGIPPTLIWTREQLCVIEAPPMR